MIHFLISSLLGPPSIKYVIFILLFILSITSFTISKDLNNKEVKTVTNETIATTLDEYAPENKEIKMLADKDNTEPVA